MRFDSRAAAVAALAAAIAAGCGSKEPGYKPKPVAQIPKASVAPGEEATLFPLAVGNQWVFTAKSRFAAGGQAQDTDGELTLRVASVANVANGKQAVIEIIQDGKVNERQIWVQDAKGVFQVRAGRNNVQFSPRIPVIEFPIQEGRTTQWRGTGPVPAGNPGPHAADIKILGVQEVDTDMGRMSAYAVESQSKWTRNNVQGSSVGTTWFAPKIGMVRFRLDLSFGQLRGTQSLALKSHSLKN